MFTEKVKKLLNEQITKEFYSAYLYCTLRITMKSRGLKGFANWFTVQAQEERDHALLFIKYMQNNDIQSDL
jgi:ferritin